ncbi:hypothetical protein C5167_051051 [Papaver somniferum]|uniref:Uncharacterized protein n=1 Tax=Papaver somniferum TaxID=3469 RepID=A0A4Y7KRT6_PAPSO|nr:hypothetical protein C5167_051051 [Papaver somniferum]
MVERISSPIDKEVIGFEEICQGVLELGRGQKNRSLLLFKIVPLDALDKKLESSTPLRKIWSCSSTL